MSGFVPKGLRETGMCLVLMGDGKRICQTVIIARRPVALGQPRSLSGSLLPD